MGLLSLLNTQSATETSVKIFPNFGDFPQTGEEGIIYVAVDSDLVYIWDGAAYKEIDTTVPIVDNLTSASATSALSANQGRILNESKLENIVEDTTPQLGGDLDTNSFDIKFLDNDKAIFGTGLDFEIYSDGNDAILRQLIQDKDIIFNVNNGGGDTEALRIYGNDATKRMEMFGNGFVINGGAFTFIDEGSAANARGEVYSDNSAQNAGFLFIRGRGTYASPAALQSGDDIFSLSTLGFYAAGLSSNQGTFEVETTENWDASNRGIKWILTGTPIGSINRIPHAIFEEGRITLPHTSGVADSAVIKFEEKDTTPANPANGTEVKMYMKDDKIIFQYNDAGTVRYKYLDLTGTGVTWQHSTTAP